MTTPQHPSGPPEQERGAESADASSTATPGVPSQQPPPDRPGPNGHPDYPYPMQQRPTNGFAIASLVLGILIIVSWGLTGILALIFGYIARKQIRERGEGGDGLAVAGIVLGWVAIGFLAIFVVFAVLGPLFWFRF